MQPVGPFHAACPAAGVPLIASGLQNTGMSKRRRSWIRRLVWTGVGLTALAVATYTHVTNPARLRSRALTALRSLSAGTVDVGRVTFSPSNGLELSDLVIESSNATDHRWPPLLRIGYARINCDLLALLAGRIDPTNVELRNVALAVVLERPKDSPTDDPRVFDQAARFRRLLNTLQRGLPHVTIERADLQLLVLEDDRLRLLRRMPWRAAVDADDDGYVLRADRRPATRAPLAQARWQRSTGELEFTLDWTELDNIIPLLPSAVADQLKQLNPAGRVRLERLVIRPASSLDSGQCSAAAPQVVVAELRMQDGRCVLPVEERAAATQPRASLPGYYLDMSSVSATLSYASPGTTAAATLKLRAQGHVHGAPTNLTVDLRPDLATRLATATQREITLDDVLSAEMAIEGLELPTHETYPDFVQAPRLGSGLTNAFHRYKSRGKVSLRLTIVPPGTLAADGAPLTGSDRMAGELEPLGTAFTYYEFPYDLVGVTGLLRYERGRVLLDNLRGYHGGGAVCANGIVNSTESWTGFDLTFQGTGTALDDDLYAALPEKYKQLWRSTAPLGVCDVTTTVRRPDGSDEHGSHPTAVDIAARLLGASLALGDGRRIDQADGNIVIQAGKLQINNLHGYDGQTSLRLDGTVSVRNGETETDVRVQAANLPIKHAAPLTPDGELMSAFQFTGQADVWGRIFDTPEAGRRQHLAVHMTSGRLIGLVPDRHWTVREAWISVRGDEREVLSLDCRQGDAWLTGSGKLPAPAGCGDALALTLQAGAPAIEELYPQFVPPRWARFADDLGLSGPGTIDVRLRAVADDAAPSGQVAEIELHTGSMKARWLPLDLHAVQAAILFAPQRFKLHPSTARWGADGRIEAKGHGTWDDDSTQAEFTVDAHRLLFCRQLMEALPRPLANALQPLHPVGEFDAQLSGWRTTAGDQTTWRLEGSVPLRHTTLELGLKIDDLDARIDGSCTIGPAGEVELDAEFLVAGGSLAGRRIERCEGRLTRSPQERWLRLDDLRGRGCGGEAVGSLLIDPQTAEYELELTLHDVSVAQLMPPPSDDPGRKRPGRVDGDVWLRGTAGDKVSRRGGGTLRVSGASFLQTPVLASVAAEKGKDNKISDTVDEAVIRFLWGGEQVWLERVDIRSRDLRLVGRGTWNLGDDSIRMTLVGAHPEHWPRVAVLTDLIELAGRELVQYHVEGTLAAPTVRVEPLHRLNNTLRALLGSEEPEAED